MILYKTVINEEVMKKYVSTLSLEGTEFENCVLFPYMIRELIYKSWDDTFPNKIEFKKQPTMSEIRRASDKLIQSSNDFQHIYIENFSDKGNGVFQLECGS